MRNNFLLLSLPLLFIYANAFYSQNKAFIQESEYSLQDTVLAVRFIAKGDSLFQISKYDSSNTYFEKGKEIYDVLYQKYNEVDFLRKSLHCENKIGWNFIILGEYKTVLLRLQQALDYTGRHIDENFIETAHSYQIIGEAYLKQSDYYNAIENHQKSIALKLKILGEGTRQLVSNYTSLGIIHFELGDYDRALDYYLNALELTPHQENKNKLLIAKFYNNIGNVYDKKGDLEKALEFHKNSLSIRIGQLGEDHIDVSSSYTNIGIICSRKGNYVDALGYFNKSLAIKQQVLGELHPDVARNYGNIGDNYYSLRDFENAIKYSLKSLEIITTTLGEANPAAINRYITLGNIYKEKSDFELSIEYLEKAIASAIKIFGSKHPDIGKSYTHLAEVFNLKNDFKTALKFCQKSIVSLVEAYENESIYDNPELEGILSETELLNSLSLKAIIFNELSELTDLKMSLTTYQLAVNLLDKMRTGYKSEGSKLFLREQAAEIYDQVIYTSLKLFDHTNEPEYKQRAFLFAEKSKAAVLQDGIAEVQARQFAGVSSDLLNEEKQLRINLAFYETELQKELQKKDSLDKIKITELENQLFGLKSRYEELISHLEKKYPDYFNLKYQTKTITVRDVQENLPDNTALIEYFIGSDVIYIFTFSRDEFDIISIKKPNNFEEIIKVFYSSILKTDRENYIKLGNELSKCLIMPVISNPDLQDKEKLVIIPHELLHKIPFEALFTSTQSDDQTDYTEYNYLIKKFDISYHYSASLYNNTPGRNTDKDDNFIGFAPVFAKNDLTGYTLVSNDLINLPNSEDDMMRSVTFDGKKFNELEHSEWEIKSILSLFNRKNIEKNSYGYFYSDATEEKFKESIKDYSIVHIATHSFINESHPQISGIVFAQPDTNQNSEEDGMLYAGEIYNLDLNADLVVLSSCESGLGKLIKGEGLMALTRGFLYSGANNVIFSLWKVPDKPTSELMVEFYKNILSGKSYGNSLREAKLSLIKNSSTSRPRSWASFILVGGV